MAEVVQGQSIQGTLDMSVYRYTVVVEEALSKEVVVEENLCHNWQHKEQYILGSGKQCSPKQLDDDMHIPIHSQYLNHGLSYR
jgi:hypothetical protein